MSVPERARNQPEAADDTGPRLRIAIASQDGRSMNAHFGSARHFLIYEVTSRSERLLDTLSFVTVTGESGEHHADAPLGVKVDAIRGCNLLFVLAIGSAAATQVINARIHPVKLLEAEPVEQVIAKVQELMTGTPPPWLRRALASSERSMSFLEEEDQP